MFQSVFFQWEFLFSKTNGSKTAFWCSPGSLWCENFAEKPSPVPRVLYSLCELFSLVICNTVFSVGCGFIAGFSRTTVCNSGFRLCFFRAFIRRIRHSLFPASPTLYFHLEFVIWNFTAWKFFQRLALLKFTGWINDFKASFKWLQYGWSVTWQACCFSSFTSVDCIHQLPAFQKSLHSSRNGSSRLLYSHWMMFLDRFSVIILHIFCFRAELQPKSWVSAI